MTVHETLRTLRKEKGLSQVQTAEFLTQRGVEVTQRAVSKWERGDTQPNTEQFLLLCELYEVRDVLAIFRGLPELLGALNPLGKRRVREYVRLLEADAEFSAAVRERPARLTRIIPLYDLPVSAGAGQFLDSDSYELLEVDESVPLSATFAVRISGDSMTPRYVDRQIVYVKQQQTLQRGEYGIFILNGDAYCKQLSGDGETALVSLNSKYPPIAISEYDELRILGKVVGQMCGRYYIEVDEAEMRAIVAGIERYGQVATGEVFPTNIAPAVGPTGSFAAMRWGFPLPDGKGTVINARSETAADKAMFRSPMRTGRCLIPASWYFEWEKQGAKKVKFALRQPGERVIYMAGLSRTDFETGLETYVILTQPAWDGIAFIHDRMPVILPRSSHDEWLFGRDPSGTMKRAAQEMEFMAV